MVDLVKKNSPDAKSFVDIGCGGGTYSKCLMQELGIQGVGVDSSSSAIEVCTKALTNQIEQGTYTLIQGDSSKIEPSSFDFGISWMVIEHLEDESQFIADCFNSIKPSGQFYFAVPAREDLWGIEDDTCGHFRRYSRKSLTGVMEKAGFKNIEVISVNVPVSNILLSLSNYLIKTQEKSKLDMSKQEQTSLSGIREIRWKTVFPSVFKLLLNKITMLPLILLQKAFYNTDLGTVIIAMGEKE